MTRATRIGVGVLAMLLAACGAEAESVGVEIEAGEVFLANDDAEDADMKVPGDVGDKLDPAEAESGDKDSLEEAACGECVPGEIKCLDEKFPSTCAPDEAGCGKWGEPQSCIDYNPCTDDLCVAGQGCAYNNNKMPCDDLNPCTGPDSCSGGMCAPGPSTCECQQHADCAGMDDADKCNGTFKCEDYKCIADPQTVVKCLPPSSPCSIVECMPETGLCVEKALQAGAPCDDGDPCTLGDTCENGTCFGELMACEPSDDQCASAKCSNGKCVQTAVSGPCDDGLVETCNDKCADGACKGGSCEVLGGETCYDPIDLGEGGAFEVDLCDYQVDLSAGQCGSTGPDVFFKVKPNSMQGYISIDTTGSIPGVIIALRLWSEDNCASTADFGCGGVSWSGPLGLTNYLFFSASTTDGTCGPVKVTATVFNQ